MDHPPPHRRFTRRRLLKLAGAGLAFGLSFEAMRVFAFTNVHTVIPGQVYRSAQLDPDQLRELIRKKRIRTVINLRGTCPEQGWYLGEARVTHHLGISQEDVSLSAKRLPAPNEIRRMVEVLDRTEKPVVIHCQRGADRTGLVATAAVLLHTDASLTTARRQLWTRYGHVSAGRTAVIDRFFDFYEAWLKATGRTHTPDTFRLWATKEYCPGPYRADVTLLTDTTDLRTGRGFTLTFRAKNTSAESWTFTPGGSGIQMRYHLYRTSGERLFTGHAGRLAAMVKPGEHIDLTAGYPPVKEPGLYLVHADLLDTGPIELLDADFVQYGSEPLVTSITVK